MLFNSLAFLLFLPIVFTLYHLLNKKLTAQNILILLASYVFYGWWDVRFLILIFISSLVDFIVGQKIGDAENEKSKKYWLYVSLAVNLGLLGFFKYYHFFVDSFITSFSFMGLELHKSTLQVILPVGISFYTFQTLSYSLDIYRGHLTHSKDPIKFFAFVAFFPQLVAGPIERAAHLLPQFSIPRKFDTDFAISGLRLMLWGFFKKVVIADNLAQVVDIVYVSPQEYTGIEVVAAAIAFTFQVYGDFSGYSDIAIGTARLFGFDLLPNFKTPFYSRSIAEFWNRWHISLNTWFRDYIYIPMGGSRGGNTMKYRNIMTIFLVSGLWHGASWAFVIWGALNGIYMVFGLATASIRTRLNTQLGITETSLLKRVSDRLWVVALFGFGLFIFRANSIVDAFHLFVQIPTHLSYHLSSLEVLNATLTSLFDSTQDLLIMIVSVGFMMGIDFKIRNSDMGIWLLSLRRYKSVALEILIVLWIFVFGAFAQPENFVYFRF